MGTSLREDSYGIESDVEVEVRTESGVLRKVPQISGCHVCPRARQEQEWVGGGECREARAREGGELEVKTATVRGTRGS